ncbi:hypothetical protein D3C71_1972060 [compost metagenome]
MPPAMDLFSGHQGHRGCLAAARRNLAEVEVAAHQSLDATGCIGKQLAISGNRTGKQVVDHDGGNGGDEADGRCK